MQAPGDFHLDSATSAPARGLRALALDPRLLAWLSLALLAYQIGLIAFARDFPTQDGCSHAYNALVVRDLLLHPQSAFRSLYALNPYPTSNWTTFLLLSIANPLVGPRHLEQALAILTILCLYGAMFYAQTALAPQRARLWPGLNALLNVWFLWMGLYSFYLGVALSVFCVGYYIRHLHGLAARHYLWIGLLMVALYFTHPMAQVLTGLILSLVCIWGSPGVSRQLREASGDRRQGRSVQSVLRSYTSLLLSMAPSAVFLLIFLRQEKFGRPQLALSLKELGARLFFFPAGIFSAQSSDFSLRLDDAICALVLLGVFSSVLLWKRANWLSAQGGLFSAVILMFGIYLITPEEKGEAAFLTERMAWTILVFSIVAVSAQVRSRVVFSVLGLFLVPFVGAHLTLSALGARSANRARAHYFSIEQMIRPGSTLLRLNYPANQFEKKYELPSLNYDPLLHAVNAVALRRRCLSWSNYEAASKAFPVVYRSLSAADKNLVGTFQDREEEKAERLKSFLARFQTDYVLVYGEQPEPGTSADAHQDLADDFRAALETLNRDYGLIAVSAGAPVLQLYRRKR